MEERTFITVSKPPAELFQHHSLELQESDFDAIQGELFDRMEYPFEVIRKPNGIYAHYYDHPYPTKGQPYPGAVDVLHAAKKLLMGIARFCERHYFLTVFFYLLPGFVKRYYLASLLEIFVESYVIAALKPNFLTDDRRSKFPRELLRAGKVAIGKVKNSSKLLKRVLESFLVMVVEIMEYDNAHRYRGQDGLGSINKEVFMRDPSSEIARIAQLNKERERGYVSRQTRYDALTRPLRLALMFNPTLKQFLKDFVAELDLEKVKLDEADIYHNLIRPDYDICGWPIEVRQKKYLEIINKYTRENQVRILEGRQKRERMEASAQMLKTIEAEKGTPFLLFFFQPNSGDGGGMVKMLETKLSVDRPKLKEACRTVLEGKGKTADEMEKDQQALQLK